MNAQLALTLKEAIKFYIQEAEPVSSSDLKKRGKFSLSTATLRNHLNKLETLGYLYQVHVSSGRIPTDKGYRFYVDNLMTNKTLSHQNKKDIAHALLSRLKQKAHTPFYAIAQEMASFVSYTNVVLTPEGEIILNGLSNMITLPEFKDIHVTQKVLSALETNPKFIEYLAKHIYSQTKINIGHENELEPLIDCSLVLAPYSYHNKPSGIVGVLGPKRMKYTYTLPFVEFVSELTSNHFA